MLPATPGCRRDPYRNDLNFVLSMFTLEEVGATLSAGAVGKQWWSLRLLLLFAP